MSSDPTPSPADRPDPNEGNPALRARVPDHVADGCFSTGAIVMTGPSEFIVDFLQTIGRPHKIAKRVVIPHPVMPQFIEALNTNLELFKSRFGDPPTPPQQQNANQARRPTPQEIYDDLKLPDEALSGVYANGVMIGHGASEFGLDFLTSFFPQSAVSARVFVASGQVPRLLESLRSAVRQLEQRQQQAAAGGANIPAPEAPAADGASGGVPGQEGGDGSGPQDPGSANSGSANPGIPPAGFPGTDPVADAGPEDRPNTGLPGSGSSGGTENSGDGPGTDNGTDEGSDDDGSQPRTPPNNLF